MENQQSVHRSPLSIEGLSRREALLRVGASSLAVALLARGLGHASAQEETPAAEGGLPPGVALISLGGLAVPDMPAAPVTVRLTRITLDPGSSVPESSTPYPSFAFVESGTLTCPGAAGRILFGADMTGEASTGSGVIMVKTGETIYVPANVPDGAGNDGTDLVSALLVEFVSAEMMETPTA